MNINKLLKHNSIAIIMMIIISFATQVLTVMKASIVAGYFGTSQEIDAFNFANSVVSFFFGFISAGISTVVIPQYAVKEDGKAVNSFITGLYGGMFTVVAVMLLIRTHLIARISGRNDYFVYLCAFILLLLMLANMLLSVSFVTAAHYQCNAKYNTPKIINLLSQLAVVCVLLVFEEIDIFTYTYIIVAGLVVHSIVDILFAVKSGWKYHFDFSINDPETKQLFRVFFPIVISTGIYRLSLLVDSSIASRLDDGMVTILGYSGQIAGMINSLIIGNLMIYIYPKIVKHIVSGNNQEYFWSIVNLFHCIVCLIITGFFSVGKEGIAILFQRGKFDENATLAVFIGAGIYILGQQTNLVRDLIYRYFYAKGDTKTTAFNSFIVSVVNIIASIILVWCIGFYGIIIGTVIASSVSLTVIFIRFKRKFGFDIPLANILCPLGTNILASAITIILITVLKQYINIKADIISILVFGSITVMVYGLLISVINRRALFTLKQI